MDIIQVTLTPPTPVTKSEEHSFQTKKFHKIIAMSIRQYIKKSIFAFGQPSTQKGVKKARKRKSKSAFFEPKIFMVFADGLETKFYPVLMLERLRFAHLKLR